MTSDTDLIQRADDGTPLYSDTVEASYRKLQYRSSIYAERPRRGSGIRLGIFQAEAACGEGATAKNMALLEQAVGHAKQFDVDLLAFPELFIPGYTLDPEAARSVSEYSDGPSITRARQLARDNEMALIVPYAERSTAPAVRLSISTASPSSTKPADYSTATGRRTCMRNRSATTGTSATANTRCIASKISRWAC